MKLSRGGRSSRNSGFPYLKAVDAVRFGSVCLYRNPAGERFGETDRFKFEANWSALPDIATAFAAAREQEQATARNVPFAWSPEFGYLSPDPFHCGTGLRIRAEFHLEGLHLIGDLPPVLAGLEAMRLMWASVEAEGIRDAGHIFTVCNDATLGLAEEDLVRRTSEAFLALVRQELSARVRLVRHYPRVFEDAVTRAVAILQSARLLSPWEFLDLLSPLRLAASMGFLEGVSARRITEMTNAQLDREAEPPPQTTEEDIARDRRDAELADLVNPIFQNVRLNDRAREILS